LLIVTSGHISVLDQLRRRKWIQLRHSTEKWWQLCQTLATARTRTKRTTEQFLEKKLCEEKWGQM